MGKSSEFYIRGIRTGMFNKIRNCMRNLNKDRLYTHLKTAFPTDIKPATVKQELAKKLGV